MPRSSFSPLSMLHFINHRVTATTKKISQQQIRFFRLRQTSKVDVNDYTGIIRHGQVYQIV